MIKRRGGGISETFTVRKISYGVGVERTFLYTHQKSRKSKLYVTVKYAVLSFTTCVNFAEKRLVLKRSDDNDNERKELVTCNKLFFYTEFENAGQAS